MRKYSVTTPNVLQKLRKLDRDAAKPHSFCISPVPSFGGGTKVAPYCDDPNRWRNLDYVLLANGQKTRLSSVETDDEGDESFVIDDSGGERPWDTVLVAADFTHRLSPPEKLERLTEFLRVFNRLAGAAGLLRSGRVAPAGRTFALVEAARALAMLSSRQTMGKLLLAP